MALFRSFATVAGYTGASRILGFVRDILIADVLGTGAVADAFIAAFRLPNLFRRIFAEGAFNAAFVPLFAKRLEDHGEAAAKAFAEQALAVLLAALLALTAAAMAGMPWLMHLLVPGFAAEPQKLALAVELARITFPYLLFLSLAALLSGVLNALHRFAAAAAAPILLNVFAIAALALVVPLVGWPGHVLAWAVAAAGLAQFLLLMIAAGRAGMALALPRPRLTAGIRRLLRLMVPGVLSAAVMQVNLLVGTAIVSAQAGAVAYLYFADRVYQLPLGLIGIGFGIVLLPELSRRLRGGAEGAAMTSLNRGLELAMLLTLPASLALLAIPLPIVITLFEHGVFDRAASQATAWALAAFALGLPAYVLIKILQPAFFAREDTVTPLKFAGASVLVNIGLSLILYRALGYVGVALATALAAWLNTALLGLALRRRGFLVLDARLRARLPRILVASLVMGAALWAAAGALAAWFDRGLATQIVGLAILIAGGLGLYGLAALALRATALREVKALLSRGGEGRARP